MSVVLLGARMLHAHCPLFDISRDLTGLDSLGQWRLGAHCVLEVYVKCPLSVYRRGEPALV